MCVCVCSQLLRQHKGNTNICTLTFTFTATEMKSANWPLCYKHPWLKYIKQSVFYCMYVQWNLSICKSIYNLLFTVCFALTLRDRLHLQTKKQIDIIQHKRPAWHQCLQYLLLHYLSLLSCRRHFDKSDCDPGQRATTLQTSAEATGAKLNLRGFLMISGCFDAEMQKTKGRVFGERFDEKSDGDSVVSETQQEENEHSQALPSVLICPYSLTT